MQEPQPGTCPNCHRPFTARDCANAEHRQARAHYLRNGSDAAPTGARGFSRRASTQIGIAQQFAHVSDPTKAIPGGSRKCATCGLVKANRRFWNEHTHRLYPSCGGCRMKARAQSTKRRKAKSLKIRARLESDRYWQEQAALHP